ncbi:MAG: fibrillarin-like rRNA/tRNA 2'-O-methyltransferase [Thermoplasmata archaeon]|nr:fibrillarin-like rRNA/tRNA 2'-O-methyltransferase [Candidatus Sysuiplasma acidicola]MBX8645435.1 fibrillarin-like rRNA/tRNA 2'-O-methyltransferase [Candidatus Sysuiplasma acidicola]MDH2905071.1 fibrillarin-like rRNA/tRNA 2'-O-methyltransferase [Methanomassiliicoccales archaeon]
MEETVSKFDGKLFTLNSSPGWKLARQQLITSNGREYREWDPYRSKLAAFLAGGGTFFPFSKHSNVLYLGASTGTTASHVADIVPSGRVCCVEISFTSYARLAEVASHHPNMIPVLADASRPEEYAAIAGDPDVLYQDIAQGNSVEIFIKNASYFRSLKSLFLVVKARSIDSAASPEHVYALARKSVNSALGVHSGMLDISAFEKDHAVIYASTGVRDAVTAV